MLIATAKCKRKNKKDKTPHIVYKVTRKLGTVGFTVMSDKHTINQNIVLEKESGVERDNILLIPLPLVFITGNNGSIHTTY